MQWVLISCPIIYNKDWSFSYLVCDMSSILGKILVSKINIGKLKLQCPVRENNDFCEIIKIIFVFIYHEMIH